MLTQMISFLRLYIPALAKNEEGQDLVEYALLIVLIAIVVIGAVTALGGRVNEIFTQIAGDLNP